MNDAPLIGFFDSGIGGLSVLRHAPDRIPGARYLYVADSAYAPYGEREIEWVCERSLAIARFLVNQGVAAIVIACNTATALAANRIRADLSIPVVAMEPAIKPAMKVSTNKRVVVLATEATLRSERYRLLKQAHASGGAVIERACHHWVEAVEQGGIDNQELVEHSLRDIRRSGADTYILGCTHFPFLQAEIARALPSGAQIIDPAIAVVDQLVRCLSFSQEKTAIPQEPQLHVFTSGDPSKTQQRIKALLGWQLAIEPLSM